MKVHNIRIRKLDMQFLRVRLLISVPVSGNLKMIDIFNAYSTIQLYEKYVVQGQKNFQGLNKIVTKNYHVP